MESKDAGVIWRNVDEARDAARGKDLRRCDPDDSAERTLWRRRQLIGNEASEIMSVHEALEHLVNSKSLLAPDVPEIVDQQHVRQRQKRTDECNQ